MVDQIKIMKIVRGRYVFRGVEDGPTLVGDIFDKNLLRLPPIGTIVADQSRD